MAKPTLSEIVHNLIISNTALDQRVEAVKADVARLEAALLKIADSLNERHRQFAALEERVNEMKRVYEESGRRNWLIVVAFVGCLLTFLGNVVLIFWRK